MKIGVDKLLWDGVVDKAESTVNRITRPSLQQLKKTTLSRLKKMEQQQLDLIEAVEAYKRISEVYTAKMKAVAENIEMTDEQASASFKNNTVKVKFD